jgi:SagB-type dehydrogenase family enzyme
MVWTVLPRRCSLTPFDLSARIELIAGIMGRMATPSLEGAFGFLLALSLTVVACRAERVQPRPELLPAPPLMPAPPSAPAPPKSGSLIDLGAPVVSGGMALERALAARRSVRQFAGAALSTADLGQLAWAAQGVTDQAEGLRTAPSAGALYPLELYFVTRDGVDRYVPERHAFERLDLGDVREPLANAALSQGAILSAPCDVVITAVTRRTAEKYGDRAHRYVALEAGHAAQNLLLEATARGLVGVPIGAFEDRAVSEVLGLAGGEDPLYIVALGHARRPAPVSGAR